MSETDPSPADAECAGGIPGNPPEAAFLDSWEDDIRRAARAAADGNSADEEDLAQVARARLVLVCRGFPGAPTGYVRTVIGNAVRSAKRRKGRIFTSQSPFAEELTDDLIGSGGAHQVIVAIGVNEWVSRLPIRLQELYQHLYWEGRSQRETAKLMGLSQPRVSQLHEQLLVRGRRDLDPAA